MDKEAEKPQLPDMEAVYDEKISPLMTQIIDICKAHGMPLVACFQFSSDGFCTTVISPERADKRIPMAAQLLRHGFLAYAVVNTPPPANGVKN